MPVSFPTALKRELPAYQQVEDELRRLIRTGGLSLGSRLPTVRDLAGRYGTSVSTIQSALDVLARDGVIERVQGRGTFVRSVVPALGSVGIYFGRDFLHRPERAYSRELCHLLVKSLEARGVHYRFWADARPESEHTRPLSELATAVSKREIQALVLGEVGEDELSWLARLGLPFAAHAETPQSRVNYDFDQMIKLGVEDLKRQGCRSAGVILPIVAGACKKSPRDGDSAVMMESFRKWTSDFGLATRDSWIRTPARRLLPHEHEQFGYAQTQELLGQVRRPEGLLVFPDTIVRGCVTAILESGVSVPRDLKLVFHRNEGIPTLCPLPASWLVSDLRALVAALIAQVERQIEGRSAQPVFLLHSLESAGSSPTYKNKNKNKKT